LIEDDQLDQKAFIRLMEQQELPYDYTVTGSVSEARKVLASGDFDIIISDYSLGDGTAFDILDLVKNIPIIFITGTGDEELALNAWRAGAYDYLIKDLDRNYLKAVPITIENAIKHKKAEEKLQLLSGAVMSTEDSVYITDMDGRIIFVNRAFCDTYGYKPDEVLGKNSRLLYEKNSQNSEADKAFDSPESLDYHIRKDDSEFPVSISTSVIKDENGTETALVSVVRDISEHVLMENTLRNINLKLRNGYQANELAL